MSKKHVLKLSLKFLVIAIFGMSAFMIGTGESAKAATECPPKAYDDCWVPGTFYAVDPVSCECYCPNSSGLCNGPGNPYGGIDPSTCTCAEGFDACNDAASISACISGGGSWNSTWCYCDFYK